MKQLLTTIGLFVIMLTTNYSQIDCPDTVCVGDNVTYNVVNTAGSTYNWTLTPGGPLIPTTNFQNITWNVASGTYTLSVIETNQFNCIGLPQTCVVEVVNVSALLNPAGPFCEGDSPFQLIANPTGGVFTGQFTTTTGLFSPTTNGVYNITYTYTNAQGCVATSTITITVNPTPNTQPISHN